MGLASPAPPRPSTLARESPASSKLILGSSIPSMSQGFHQGSNIFSFSDEFHERPPQQQHRGREKLRPVQGFEDSTAVAGLPIAGNPLQSQAPMVVEEEEDDDEEEEEEEEEEEVPRAYGAEPSTAGATNILSEMFNFPGGPADLLACHNSLPGGYQRLQQRPAAGFLGAADSWVPYATNRQGLLMGSSNTGNWGSLEDAAVAKQDGDMNPGSSSSMRLFFMDPQSAQETRQHHWHPNSPTEDQAGIGAAAVGPLHDHPQASHHSQAFLGAGGAAYGFGGGGEAVIENQGLSLSLSSSLRQLEADHELSRVREAAAGTLFFNSQLHHHDQPEHHDLLASGHPLQIIRQGGQQQQQPLQMVMSYGGGGGCHGPVGFASAMNVLRNSKYARATQELLEEFCSVGRGGQYQLRSGHRSARVVSRTNPNTSCGHGGGRGASTSAAAAVSSSSSKVDIPVPSLSPADRFENQRKKSKLLSILEEVERRYNHYCEQMQMVVNSFDSVMGLGAATPYTALAQKAMSRHFRCLKDAVAAQLKHTCELLGEKDGTASGSGLTKGETPRLRLIDQSLRQQRAFNQMGMMEQEAWRPQRGLPDRSVNLLRAWLFEHFLHPYPSDADKHLLARQTGLSRNQVSNWFINARVRLWKPMVEEMYQQEAKERDDDDDELEEADLHRNKLEEEAANRRKTATQQIPESHSAAENDPSSAPIPIPQPRQPADDAAAAIIFAPALDDGIYGRAAAVLGPSPAAQLRFGGGGVAGSGRGSGDLSLTLGLRHAGGNAPESGRFGKC